MRKLIPFLVFLLSLTAQAQWQDCSTSASNMVSYSDDMTSASGWVKGSTTVTDDSSTTAPPSGRYGVTKTFKHVLSAGQTLDTYGQSGSSIRYVRSSVGYKISAYVKYGTAQFLGFGITGGGSYSCGFDILAGTAGTCIGVYNPKITDVGDGWRYLEVFYTGNTAVHPISRLLFQNLSSTTHSATLAATGGEILYISSPQMQPVIYSKAEMEKYVPVSTYTRAFADSRSCTPLERNLISPYLINAKWASIGITKAYGLADAEGLYLGVRLTGDGATSTHKIYHDVEDVGVGEVYYSAEVSAGTATHAWIGNESASHYWGVNVNLSSGAVKPNTDGRLRGWKVEKLPNSVWRVHLIATETPTDADDYRMVLAIGNDTASNTAPSFASSGTIIYSKPFVTAAYNIPKELRESILPDLQSASSSSSVTLSASDSTTDDIYNNREICFSLGYVTSNFGKAQQRCSCISDYVGSTKVTTLSPALDATLSSSYKYKIGDTCLLNITSVSGSVGSVTGAVGSVTATVDAQVVGMDANTVTASAIATDAIGASEIGASAITSSEFAQSAANKVWDIAPEDGTATTALGYLDAIKKYVANKMTIVGSDYEIFKDDQTTSYATGTTNSAGRDPD